MITHVFNSRSKLTSVVATAVMLMSGFLSPESAYASSPKSAPTISGAFEVDSVLSATFTIPTNCKSCRVNFTWLRANANVNGIATSEFQIQKTGAGNTYTLTSSDLGKILVLQVSLLGPRTNVTYKSAPTYPIGQKSIVLTSNETETAGA